MTFSKKFIILLPSVQSFYLSYLHHPSQYSIRQVPSTFWHYRTLACIQFIPRIKIAYHNYKKALESSYLSPEQQFKSVNHNSRSRDRISHKSLLFASKYKPKMLTTSIRHWSIRYIDMYRLYWYINPTLVLHNDDHLKIDPGKTIHPYFWNERSIKLRPSSFEWSSNHFPILWFVQPLSHYGLKSQLCESCQLALLIMFFTMFYRALCFTRSNTWHSHTYEFSTAQVSLCMLPINLVIPASSIVVKWMSGHIVCCILAMNTCTIDFVIHYDCVKQLHFTTGCIKEFLCESYNKHSNKPLLVYMICA